MTITAKFASTCPSCSKPIAVGTKVEWSKGARATHTYCVPATAAAARPAYRRQASTLARRNFASTGDYWGSGLYDEES